MIVFISIKKQIWTLWSLLHDSYIKRILIHFPTVCILCDDRLLMFFQPQNGMTGRNHFLYSRRHTPAGWLLRYSRWWCALSIDFYFHFFSPTCWWREKKYIRNQIVVARIVALGIRLTRASTKAEMDTDRFVFSLWSCGEKTAWQQIGIFFFGREEEETTTNIWETARRRQQEISGLDTQHSVWTRENKQMFSLSIRCMLEDA